MELLIKIVSGAGLFVVSLFGVLLLNRKALKRSGWNKLAFEFQKIKIERGLFRSSLTFIERVPFDDVKYRAHDKGLFLATGTLGFFYSDMLSIPWKEIDAITPIRKLMIIKMMRVRLRRKNMPCIDIKLDPSDTETLHFLSQQPRFSQQAFLGNTKESALNEGSTVLQVTNFGSITEHRENR